MQDRAGEIIYIGKAKNLKKRVSSYFRGKSVLPKTSALVKNIYAISTIITNSEVEALLLEDTLIKKHLPKYNIELKDNKRYPLIKIDFNKDYPRLQIVRTKKEQDRVQYFGPYSGSITRTVQLLNRLFPLVKCKNYKTQKGCLYKDMNKCLAPCLENSAQNKKRYRKVLSEVIVYLEGNGERLINSWQKKMKKYSRELDYEQAAVLRDQIELLNKLIQPQIVVAQRGSFDLWVQEQNASQVVFYLFKVRQGRLSGDYHQKFEANQLIDQDEILDRLLLAYYKNNPDTPATIYLPYHSQTIKDWIEAAEIKIHADDSLTALAKSNALLLISDEQNVILKRLQEVLGLERLPRRIECYDISTIMGRDTVASRVVAVSGKMRKDLYRHYIINSVSGKPDDFAAMQEVLTRRLRDLEQKDDELPDLIVLDGGKGQLSTGLKVLDQLQLDLPLISLAKREEIIVQSDMSELKLPLDSMEMRLILQLRNEAHRFAVNFHRKRRKKSFNQSELDDLKGVGKATKIRLLKTFGSVDNIRKAGESELQKIVSKNIAKMIKEKLL